MTKNKRGFITVNREYKQAMRPESENKMVYVFKQFIDCTLSWREPVEARDLTQAKIAAEHMKNRPDATVEISDYQGNVLSVYDGGRWRDTEVDA